MHGSLLAFTPAERIALETIQEERPGVLAALRERLAPVVEELSRTSQGLVVTELEVERLLDRLREEFVGRMMAEMEPWEEDEDLRQTAVELVTRHLLMEGRRDFVHRVVALKRN